MPRRVARRCVIVICMIESAFDTSLPPGGESPRRVGPACWALLFCGLTIIGLGVFTWILFVMHTLAYSVASMMAPESEVGAPIDDRYGLAFAVGVLVNLAGALALVVLASRTTARKWPPVAQGLGAAVVAAMAASCAVLLTLGINPVEFVLAS